MIGAIGYLLACFLAAVILTAAVIVVKPIRHRDETRPLPTLLFFFVLCVTGPYAFAEVLTRWKGAPMKEPVQQVLEAAEVQGPLRYYRVVYASGPRAVVIAVAEDSDQGWKESCVLNIKLRQENGTWKATGYTVVNSLKRNKDGISFPPYY